MIDFVNISFDSNHNTKVNVKLSMYCESGMHEEALYLYQIQNKGKGNNSPY